MTPATYVQEKAAPAGSSLHYALMLLPPDARPALLAYAAYCREVNAIPDEVHDPGVAASKLAWWAREVEAAFAGQPSHPVTQALMPHAVARGIPREALLAPLEGARTDLEQSRFLDAAALARYLAQAAGVPAATWAHALLPPAVDEATRAQAAAAAARLGAAVRSVRLLRDLGADARRGRIYLPISELQAHDVKAHEILRREPPYDYGHRFAALMADQSGRARAALADAQAALPASQRRALRPLIALARQHEALLGELERCRFEVLHQRIALTPLRKLWIAVRTQWTVR